MKGSWSVVEKNETGVETLVPIDLRVLATRIVDAKLRKFPKDWRDRSISASVYV